MRFGQKVGLAVLMTLATAGCGVKENAAEMDNLNIQWAEREAAIQSRLDSTRTALEAMRTKLSQMPAAGADSTSGERAALAQRIAEREREIVTVDQMIQTRRTERESAMRADSREDLEQGWQETQKEYDDAIARLDLILGDLGTIEATLSPSQTPIGNAPVRIDSAPPRRAPRVNRNPPPADTVLPLPPPKKNDGKGIELNRNE